MPADQRFLGSVYCHLLNKYPIIVLIQTSAAFLVLRRSVRSLFGLSVALADEM